MIHMVDWLATILDLAGASPSCKYKMLNTEVSRCRTRARDAINPIFGVDCYDNGWGW